MINNLPNELQYMIIDNIALQGIRKVYNLIEDKEVKSYAREKAIKYQNWDKTDIEWIARNGDLEGVMWKFPRRNKDYERVHEDLDDEMYRELDGEILYQAIISRNEDLIFWLINKGITLDELYENIGDITDIYYVLEIIDLEMIPKIFGDDYIEEIVTRWHSINHDT